MAQLGRKKTQIWKFIIVCTLIAAISVVATEAKTYDKCELAKELLKAGFQKNDMPKWLCLIDKLSGFSTSKEDFTLIGKKTVGLFQFSEETDCDANKKGGKCDVKCADLKTTEVTTAAKCALKLSQGKKFAHWPEWKNTTCNADSSRYNCRL